MALDQATSTRTPELGNDRVSWIFTDSGISGRLELLHDGSCFEPSFDNAPTVPAFIGDKLKDGVGVFVALSLLTLPFTAAVYYAESIVSGWQNGPKPLSIVGSHEPKKREL